MSGNKTLKNTGGAITTVCFILLLAGCAAVGPDYEPPPASAPQTWSSDLKKGLQATETDPLLLSSWWKCLNDPLLTELIDQAVRQNLDLKNAQARLREARARRGIRNADRFPTLDAGGSVTTGRSSEETGTGRRSDLFAAGFDAGPVAENAHAAAACQCQRITDIKHLVST